jgi:uncharacterized protein
MARRCDGSAGRRPGAASGRTVGRRDRLRAAENLATHGVSFEEAATVFRDPLSVTGSDPDHSLDEERFVTFGTSIDGSLLAIAHTDHDDTIRIISARPVTPSERTLYEED